MNLPLQEIGERRYPNYPCLDSGTLPMERRKEMRLAELSERSGVSTATIKYYLREGLLAPGRQVNATHGRVRRGASAPPASGARVDPGGQGPGGHRPRGARGTRTTSRSAVRSASARPCGRCRRLLTRTRRTRPRPPRRPRWTGCCGRWAGTRRGRSAPSPRCIVRWWRWWPRCCRLGYPCDAELMAPYAELMHQAAVRDLDHIETLRVRHGDRSSGGRGDGALRAGAARAAPAGPGGGVGAAVRHE